MISQFATNLLLSYANEAKHWDGMPPRNAQSDQEFAALQELERAGLIYPEVFEYNGKPVAADESWVSFTQAGIDFAIANGAEDFHYEALSA